MKMTPVFYQGINCIDILPINYAKYLNREIELIFAHSWNFRFDPHLTHFGDCFGVEETKLTPHQYAQLGFKREFFSVDDFAVFIQFLRESFKDQKPVGVYIDSFYCPWHSRFQVDHGSHYVLAFDLNDHHEIVCLDPGFNEQGVEKLPLSWLEKGYQSYFTLENMNPIRPIDDVKAYMDVVTGLEKLAIPAKIRAFSRHFNQHFDYAKDCKDILYNPWACPVFRTLMAVVGGRRQFMHYLQWIHEKIEISGYEAVMRALGHLCSKWDAIRWLLVKSKSETFNDKYRSQISEMLCQIAQEEERVINMLVERSVQQVFSSIQDVHSLAQLTLSEDKIDLVDLLNNRAFGPQNEMQADLTGLSEWGVYDDALGHAVDLLKADFKLEIHGQNELDHVTCLGQQIKIPSKPYHELVILATADFGDFMTTIQLLTTDGQKYELAFNCDCWTNSDVHPDKLKLSFSRATKKPQGSIELYENKGHIYEYRLSIPTDDPLTTIVLPLCPNIHIFAMNLRYEDKRSLINKNL